MTSVKLSGLKQQVLDVSKESIIQPHCFNTFILANPNNEINMNPIELSYYQDDSIVQKHYIQPTKCKEIPLISSGLVDKITLVNFPKGKYNLSIGGHNVGTSVYNINTQDHEFDFRKHRSNEFNVINNKIISNGTMIRDRKYYMDLSNINKAIIYQVDGDQITIGKLQEIHYHGYFTDLSTHKLVEKTEKFVTNSDGVYPLNLRPHHYKSHTMEMDLYFKSMV